MATRLKTVEFAFTQLNTMANNTLTTISGLTIYLPETGTKTFRSVVLNVSTSDDITATGGSITTKTVSLRLNAVAYSTIANANTLTHSAQNINFFTSQDFTAYFQANWTSTSMTSDIQLTFNHSTGTTTTWSNVCATLSITYEYDDTSATQIKTVYIPLNAAVGAAGTAKSVVYDATIPQLNTWLPENAKTFRNKHVIIQGNYATAGSATTSAILNAQFDTLTALASAPYVSALTTSDCYFRQVWDVSLETALSTTATHSFYVWGGAARFNHLQAYLVVTYEFTISGTSRAMNSLFLPLDFTSPMGGTAATDYQRAEKNFWIEEPGTISDNKIAAYLFWEQAAAISTLQFRVGTGSFITYTDTAAILCGQDACMVRNDASFTLARGYNNINVDCWRSDTADFGWCLSGFIIVCYSSDIATAGIGAHNHTVLWGLQQTGTGAAVSNLTIAATAPVIPEANYFITGLGTWTKFMASGTTAFGGISVSVERLAAEGGIKWEPVYVDPSHSDPEVGLHQLFSQIRDLFKRYPNDKDASRVDLETARRWRIFNSVAATGWHMMNLIITYHTITYTVSGTVTGSAGGTVNLYLHRDDAAAFNKGELLDSTTRAGNGAYSFTWYDNTQNVVVTAYEDGTHIGRSAAGVAT